MYYLYLVYFMCRRLWLALQMHAAHKAGMGVGVVLLAVLVVGVGFVGYHFYTHNTKPFRFHYFKVSGY